MDAGTKENIKERVAQLKNEIANTKSSYDKEKLQERLAKLAGGVAVLYVGANSEVEMKEKKDRVDDALCATRAAAEEGVVVGGGTTYIRAQKVLADLKGENADEQTGINIGLPRYRGAAAPDCRQCWWRGCRGSR